jgi:hypothetical protein
MATNTTFAYEPSFAGLFDSYLTAQAHFEAEYRQRETNPVFSYQAVSENYVIMHIDYGDEQSRMHDEFEIESVEVKNSQVIHNFSTDQPVDK